MQNYKELMVWEKSMDLVEEVYRIVSLLPKQEHLLYLISFAEPSYRFLQILPKDMGVML